MPTGVKPKAIKIRKNKALFRNSNCGYFSSYSTPTGCLNQLKFVKIKSSLETPTMDISSYSTPTGVQFQKLLDRFCLNGLSQLGDEERILTTISLKSILFNKYEV